MANKVSTFLVTGANGYVAAHVVHTLLEAGHNVKGTVRSQSSVDQILKSHPGFEDRLSFASVPDITVSGAFDEAVKGVDGIMHLASPFTLDVPDFKKFLVDPAIRGTLTILEAASTAPAVKRVVITSSFAAINVVSLGLRPGHTYTETDWNTETYEGAITTTNSSVAYCAGKALAEKAAWDYIKEKKPHFSISVVNPPKIFGPSQQKLSLSSLGISMTDIYGLINGNMKDVPPTGFWAWVDVRDAAEAHLRAFESADAANERFFITGGRYTYQQICEVLRASPKIPDSVKSKIPRGDPKDVPGPHVYDVDNSKSIRVLGMKYRALEDTVVDAALNLLEYM